MLKLGDITKEVADALVNPANSMLYMGGGVAGALKRAGGREIEEEALKKAPVPVGNAIATTAGRLKAKFVIHSPTMPRPAMRTEERSIQRATKAALELTEALNLRSIVFPGMGTGVGGVPQSIAAQTMVKATEEHLRKGSKLNEIRFISLDENMFQAFKEAVESL